MTGSVTPISSQAKVLAAGALLALAACSRSSTADGSTADLFIESCSLACTNGTGGASVFCGVVNVTENQEISILFSRPIMPSSVSSATLQVIDVGNGTAPEGLRFVDPLDPRRVVFRPSITFANGGVEFSFKRNRSYEIRIPGAAQGDPGPFITSLGGRPNQSRLVCSVFTSEGVADIVPGNPSVTVQVDVVTSFDAMGNPLTTARETIGSNLATAVENVSRNSGVYFNFNELMFLPTLANNVTNESPFIRVELDTDSDLATAGGDRIEIPGSYEFFVDQFSLTTSLEFTPFGFIPSAGSDPFNPNILVVRIPTQVTDIAQPPNPVTSQTGGGILVAIPEILTFPSVTLPDDDGENFDNPAGGTGSLEDAASSGSAWGNGRLSAGLTGGSGRHGALRIPANETVTLNTDSQTFPLTVVAQIDVIGNGSGAAYPNSLTVTDGVFEFSTIDIAPQGRLVLTGSNPARLLCRGRCVIAPGGLIDASGSTGTPHDSATPAGQGPLLGGPNGADGGQGGDKIDNGMFASILGTNGTAIANPGAVRAGRPGGNIGREPLGIGAGNGGMEFPATVINNASVGPANNGDTAWNIDVDPLGEFAGDICIVYQIGSSGGGGGYVFNGGDATLIPLGDLLTAGPPGMPTQPPPATGGNTATLGLAPADINNTGYTTRILRWQDGDLRGGASGGGGGNHTAGIVSEIINVTPTNCFNGFLVTLQRYLDHSGSGGGGGGGALEILPGRDADIDGTIDATGGEGGSALSSAATNGSFAMPGGGGSGGAVRIRSPFVDLGPTAMIRIGGGPGGDAPWSMDMTGMRTTGGDGSVGLVRIEDGSGTLDFNTVVNRVVPFDLGNPMASLEYLSVAPSFVDAASIGQQRPDSITGSTGCWMLPAGNFLQLLFQEDTGTGVDDMGWTMDLVLDDGMGGTTLRPFRGTDAGNPVDFEQTYGSLLGYDLMAGEMAAPIVVRFQGGRSRQTTLSNPCNVNANDPFGDIQPGSLTPWVAHPADLNQVLDPSGAPFASNMVRYCILFDLTDDGAMDRPGQILIDEQILGVTNLRIVANPD